MFNEIGHRLESFIFLFQDDDDECDIILQHSVRFLAEYTQNYEAIDGLLY